jgi:hypothetical protein
MKIENSSNLYPTKEVASFLGIGVRALLDRIGRGEIQARCVGRKGVKLYFTGAEVHRHIAAMPTKGRED